MASLKWVVLFCFLGAVLTVLVGDDYGHPVLFVTLCTVLSGLSALVVSWLASRSRSRL